MSVMRLRVVCACACVLMASWVSAETPANTTASGAKSHPGVSVRSDATGGFVVVWSGNGADGSGSGIVCRVFDASGAAVTGEFVVNTSATETAGDQTSPVVSVDGSGNFVVSWQGSGNDVYVKRYLSNGTAVPS